MQENLRTDFWKGDITASKESKITQLLNIGRPIVSHCKTIENLR